MGHRGKRVGGHRFLFWRRDGKGIGEAFPQGVCPDLYRDYREKRGKYRYTEWRIEEREQVYAFAMASDDADGLSVRFDLPGSFTPILSNDGALENRSDYGTKGVLLSALSVSLFCFACLFFCLLLRIHWVLFLFPSFPFWFPRFCFTSP